MHYILLTHEKEKLYLKYPDGKYVSINNASHFDQNFYNDHKNNVSRSSTWVRVDNNGTKEKIS
jgi:hypothetical protein